MRESWLVEDRWWTAPAAPALLGGRHDLTAATSSSSATSRRAAGSRSAEAAPARLRQHCCPVDWVTDRGRVELPRSALRGAYRWRASLLGARRCWPRYRRRVAFRGASSWRCSWSLAAWHCATFADRASWRLQVAPTMAGSCRAVVREAPRARGAHHACADCRRGRDAMSAWPCRRAGSRASSPWALALRERAHVERLARQSSRHRGRGSERLRTDRPWTAGTAYLVRPGALAASLGVGGRASADGCREVDAAQAQSVSPAERCDRPPAAKQRPPTSMRRGTVVSSRRWARSRCRQRAGADRAEHGHAASSRGSAKAGAAGRARRARRVRRAGARASVTASASHPERAYRADCRDRRTRRSRSGVRR